MIYALCFTNAIHGYEITVHKIGRSDRGLCESLIYWHGTVQGFSGRTVRSGPGFKTLYEIPW